MRLFYVENACNVFKDQQLVMVFFRMEFHFLILEYVVLRPLFLSHFSQLLEQTKFTCQLWVVLKQRMLNSVFFSL